MSRITLHDPTRGRGRPALACLGIGAVVGSTLLVVGSPPAGAVVTTTGSPGALGAAMAGPGANVTGSSWAEVPATGTPHAVSTTPLAGLPTNGASFAVLTTGDANLADDPNISSGSGAALYDDSPRGSYVHDASVLKIDLSVPSTANCLSFDFKFLSDEYPEWVDSAYNDAFVAELDSSTWSTTGNVVNAPDNFAFDGNNNPISVNAVGLGGGFSPANAAGTTYDGATPRLSAAKQVSPGAHSLYLSIFDMGDYVLDSAVFVDNLRVGWVPDPATQCQPGAQVKQFQLDLAPATATNDTGTSHTVTATLKDLNASPQELSGGTVLFAASGVHAVSGSDVTDGAGQATFTYTGTNVGTDTISACYDANNNGSCGSDEPFASAQATWTNAPPTNDAGGPYSGDEGSAVAISGTASDINGDSLTHTWSVAPVSGVDAGASCTIADPSALSTTVTCTDDGVRELTLTTDDGFNPPVTDTASLTIGNLAPSIGSMTTTTDPTVVGTPVLMQATYGDPGSNDTHTASVDWGDGTTTTPPAAAGTVTASHAYTSAGVYTVCLTVTDDDAASDAECSENYVVVYDPGAGFVTGGGWINAPAGSYPADPSASGPGRFGFVSKYAKGATTPSGSTEFQFQAGDLNFHSSSYDWLVVAGAKALYKGEGTVNGDGGYKFLVSAVDGAKPGGGGVDRFRIKIWEAGTGTVVFDNQIGAVDDATAATAISKGSIVIHS